MRRVCVVTGSRAEYGLLFWLMKGIQDSASLELQLIATGMHLSPEFGLTYKQIQSDGFHIDRKVEMLLSADTPTSISKSTALGLIGMGEAFAELTPDLIVLLGDRFEILAAAIAATYQRIPIANIHGGEATFGVIDEPIRHSITKMSHLHFTAAEEYRRRVIQLGEDPSRVYNVGAVGLDGIQKLKLLDRDTLGKDIGVNLHRPTLLITFHPVTLEHSSADDQIQALLSALNTRDFQLIFTLPNADTDGRVIRDRIEEFQTANRDSVFVYTSLGQVRYLSLLQYVVAVIGNSSSGLIEVPGFGIPTINIGDRQAGRLAGLTVIHCDPDTDSIKAGIDRALSADFRNSIIGAENPYGTGGASEKILEVMMHANLDGVLKKRFYDIHMPS